MSRSLSLWHCLKILKMQSNKMNVVVDSGWSLVSLLGKPWFDKSQQFFLITKVVQNALEGQCYFTMNTSKQIKNIGKTPYGGCVENNSEPKYRLFLF